jgi:hypothetical protein
MTKEDIIRMAREAGGYLGELPLCDAWLFVEEEHLQRFAALVAAAQREKDAQICESVAMKVSDHKAIGAEDCAAAIRARGQG